MAIPGLSINPNLGDGTDQTNIGDLLAESFAVCRNIRYKDPVCGSTVVEDTGNQTMHVDRVKVGEDKFGNDILAPFMVTCPAETEAAEPIPRFDHELVCIDNGDNTTRNGWAVTSDLTPGVINYFELDGTTPVTDPIVPCTTDDVEAVYICYENPDTGAKYQRVFWYKTADLSTVFAETWIDEATGLDVPPDPAAVPCESLVVNKHYERICYTTDGVNNLFGWQGLICDAKGTPVETYILDDALVSVEGAFQTTCPAGVEIKTHYLWCCDDLGDPTQKPVKFLKKIQTTYVNSVETDVIHSAVNPDLSGPYTIVGNEVTCDFDQDVEPIMLEDENGVCFLRKYLHTDGVLDVTFVDTELDGVTAYTPVGLVGPCTSPTSDFDPICYNVPPSTVVLTGFVKTVSSPAGDTLEIYDNTLTLVAGAIQAQCVELDARPTCYVIGAGTDTFNGTYVTSVGSDGKPTVTVYDTNNDPVVGAIIVPCDVQADREKICFTTDAGVNVEPGWVRFVEVNGQTIKEIYDVNDNLVLNAEEWDCPDEDTDYDEMDVCYTLTGSTDILRGCKSVKWHLGVREAILFDKDGAEVPAGTYEIGDCPDTDTDIDREATCYSTDGGVTLLDGFVKFVDNPDGSTIQEIYDLAGNLVAGAVAYGSMNLDTDEAEVTFCVDGANVRGIYERSKNTKTGVVVDQWALTGYIDQTGAFVAGALPAGAVQGVCKEDVIDVTYLPLCVDNVLNIATYVTTNGIPATAPTSTVPFPGEYDCEKDYEFRSYCDAILKTTHLQLVEIADSGVRTDVVGAVHDTEEVCNPTIVRIDFEFKCNTASNLQELYQWTVVDGVPGTPTVTPTTTACNEPNPDYEIRRTCNPVTNTTFEQLVSVVDGVETNVGAAVNTLTECNKECLTPIGKEMCYGSGSGDSSHTNTDNNTDADFSIGGTGTTLIKWNVQTTNSEDAPAFTQDIVACIESGETANITITDVGGNSYTFPATGIDVAGNADGTGNWLFSGPGAPASGSGKVLSATLVCSGSSSGKACNFYNCETDSIIWKDSLTGVELTAEQIETLEECTPVEDCEITDFQAVLCAAEAITDSNAGAIAVGDQILVIGKKDCENNVVSSKRYLLTNNQEVVDAILTDTCDPEPDVETVKECIKDTDDNQWTQIIVVDNSDAQNPTVLAEFFYDSNLELGTPAGESSEWTSCEECEGTPECIESQEWTYGIDNGGTIYTDVADYVIELSDGSILNFSQDGTSTSWTPQLQEWSANIQAAADAAGLAWFVEPRAVNNPNPTDISGNYGASPTGLPGAPSVPVAQALIAGGMVARYVNIQICPGQPVPVRAYRTTSTLYTNNPYDLTTAGAILGPIQKFIICRCCGEEPVWYLEDGVTLATAGQIPNCYEPCGTLALVSAPPDREVTFETLEGCDNVGQNDIANFVSVTRRTAIASDGTITVAYFIEDPTDPSAVIPYTLIGDFVDCSTGEVIPSPVPACTEFEITTLYRMDESTVSGDLRNREWDLGPRGELSDTIAEFALIRENFDFSQPTTIDAPWANLSVNDTNGSSTVQDAQVIDGYIIVDQPLQVRWSGTSYGYHAVELGKCCGDLELVSEDRLGGANGTVTQVITLPKGIHQIRLWNIDDYSNTSRNLQYTTDGINWITDNTPPGVQFSTGKPVEICEQVKVCEDTGAMFGLLDGLPRVATDYYDCSLLCTPISGSTGSTGDSECPPETTQTVNGSGPTTANITIPAGYKSVTINRVSGTTTISTLGGFELGPQGRPNTITLDSTNHSCINGLLPTITVVTTSGEAQWFGIRD